MRLILVLLANSAFTLWQRWSPDSYPGPGWYVFTFVVCSVWALVGDYLEYANLWKNMNKGGR